MKRLIALVMLICITLTVVCHGVSSDTTIERYEIAELDLSVDIPSRYLVITSDTPESDPFFSLLGSSKSEVMLYFQSSNIYLDAISNDLSEEIVVTMVDSMISDFNLISDTVLTTIMTSQPDEYKNYGISVSKREIFQHSQAKFVKIYWTDNDQTVNGLQYYTVYDGKLIDCTLRSYTGSLNYEQEQTIKTIVESIHFNTDPQKQEDPAVSPAYTYSDPDTKVEFTVPANWTEGALSEPREYIDVKFLSSEEQGLSILYGSTDLWDKMPSWEKNGLDRTDINNSYFTYTDMAEMGETDIANVQKVTYNGTQCFRIKSVQTTEAYGLSVTVTLTHVIYFDNGWMYWFQFSGDSQNEFFSDFESLLNTVTFPKTIPVVSTPSIDSESTEDTTTPPITGADASNNSASGDSGKQKGSDESNGGKWMVFSVICIIAVITIIAIFIILKKKKEETKAMSTNIPTSDKYQYCSRCGSRLSYGSNICNVCGPKAENRQIKTEVQEQEPSPASSEPYIPSPEYAMYLSGQKMKWYKFLIYFLLFASAFLNLVSGVGLLTGSIYATQTDGLVTSELVYATYGSGMMVLDKIYGIYTIGIAVLAVVTRFRLSGYKTNAPLFMFLFYALMACGTLIYTIIGCSIAGVAFEASDINSVFIQISLIIYNHRYFKARKMLFVW